MTNTLVIRPESPADVEAITDVNVRAFEFHPHSEQTEHFIVRALRRDGALTVSLVAELAEKVVGHIAFSPVRFSDGSPHWHGLAPVAVLPGFQRQGIGKALIDRGLETLRAMSAAGCVVLGDPDFYGRFGFRHRPDCIFEGVPAGYFQVLAFHEAYPVTGTVTYHDAFDARR